MSKFYYVTKWAATQGVLEVPKNKADIVGGDYLSHPHGYGGLFIRKAHWCEEAELKEQLRKVADRRIASAKRALKKAQEFGKLVESDAVPRVRI